MVPDCVKLIGGKAQCWPGIVLVPTRHWPSAGQASPSAGQASAQCWLGIGSIKVLPVAVEQWLCIEDIKILK